MTTKNNPLPEYSDEAKSNLVGFFDVLIEMDLSTKESEIDNED